LDPRLRPTPDYGTLGPGSDAAGSAPGSSPAANQRQAVRVGSIVAALLGASVALVVGTIGRTRPAEPTSSKIFSDAENKPVQAGDPRQIDRLGPQEQAAALLQLAVMRKAGATEQISYRVDRWQGKLRWDSQMASLTQAALNSDDMRVRESGIEVELAAYGLAKNSSSVDYLLRTAESGNHAQKIWALWALGLMANRGVQADQVFEVLTAHLKDSDEDARRWTVEGLGLAGSDQAVGVLLQTMHDDPSALVRERAACALAESGMFTPRQRMSAVPQLLNYTDDPSLDAQTHGWAFHALNDITRQHLPNDSAAWRNWYEARGNQ